MSYALRLRILAMNRVPSPRDCDEQSQLIVTALLDGVSKRAGETDSESVMPMGLAAGVFDWCARCRAGEYDSSFIFYDDK